MFFRAHEPVTHLFKYLQIISVVVNSKINNSFHVVFKLINISCL